MSQQNHGGEAHGSVKEYVTGLILSIVLTLIPFGLVVYGGMSPGVVMTVIILCAIAQLLVQGIFFLHLNDSSQFWNTTSAIYIIFTVLFFVIGSIWIFSHLNHNMLMGH